MRRYNSLLYGAIIIFYLSIIKVWHDITKCFCQKMSLTRPSKLWIRAKMLSKEYLNSTRLFIKFAQASLGKEVDLYCCPCITCQNSEKSTSDSIYEHIICKWIDNSYPIWVHHWEPFAKRHVKIRTHRTSTPIDHGVVFLRVEDMVNNAFGRTSPSNLNACLNGMPYPAGHGPPIWPISISFSITRGRRVPEIIL